jgi:hypothetical protein
MIYSFFRRNKTWLRASSVLSLEKRRDFRYFRYITSIMIIMRRSCQCILNAGGAKLQLPQRWYIPRTRNEDNTSADTLRDRVRKTLYEIHKMGQNQETNM